MGWRPFCDLTGDELAATDVHELTVALDGDTFREFMVGARPADELLDQLGRLLVDGVAARVTPDEPLDPGPLHDAEPNDHDPSEASDADSPTGAHAAAPAAATVESPAVSVNGAMTDTTADDVGDSGTPPTPAPAMTSARVDVTAGPIAQQGEAERGQASDSTVRAWARQWELPCSSTGKLNAWVRGEFERLRGAAPDLQARRRARELGGATPTVPTVDPGVAQPSTVNVWLVRNGIEDRLPPTDAGRKAYRTAWEQAHPEPPPADPVAAGQDPSAPGDRAGRPSSPGAEAVNGKALPEQPAAASVRPAVEPVGDGTAEPDSRPEQLERADELASEGKTPRQIMAATGVWLREARAAVRKAAQR